MKTILVYVLISGFLCLTSAQGGKGKGLMRKKMEGNKNAVPKKPDLRLPTAQKVFKPDKASCAGKGDVPMCVDSSKPRRQPAEPKPDCLLCQAEASAMRLNPDRGDKVCVPTCQKAKGKEEWFTRVQRCKGQIWCVNKFGHEIKGSRKKGNTIDCKPFLKVNLPKKSPCQMAKAEARKRNKDYIPSCTRSGKHFHTQCTGFGKKTKYCWCSMMNGKPVPNTFHAAKRKDKPDCQAHYTTSFSCKGFEGVRPHPFDCTRFLNCGPQTVFSCQCPDKQAFDPALKVCNWLKNVPGCIVN